MHAAYSNEPDIVGAIWRYFIVTGFWPRARSGQQKTAFYALDRYDWYAFFEWQSNASCAQANIRQSLPDILYAVKCSGFEIERFVKTLQQEGLLQNTAWIQGKNCPNIVMHSLMFVAYWHKHRAVHFLY